MKKLKNARGRTAGVTHAWRPWPCGNLRNEENKNTTCWFSAGGAQRPERGVVGVAAAGIHHVPAFLTLLELFRFDSVRASSNTLDSMCEQDSYIAIAHFEIS